MPNNVFHLPVDRIHCAQSQPNPSLPFIFYLLKTGQMACLTLPGSCSKDWRSSRVSWSFVRLYHGWQLLLSELAFYRLDSKDQWLLLNIQGLHFCRVSCSTMSLCVFKGTTTAWATKSCCFSTFDCFQTSCLDLMLSCLHGSLKIVSVHFYCLCCSK